MRDQDSNPHTTTGNIIVLYRLSQTTPTTLCVLCSTVNLSRRNPSPETYGRGSKFENERVSQFVQSSFRCPNRAVMQPFSHLWALIEMRNHLNVTYLNRWIGRGGSVPWPAWSPDLTPLDYFLCGSTKIWYSCTSEKDHTAQVLREIESLTRQPHLLGHVREAQHRR